MKTPSILGLALASLTVFALAGLPAANSVRLLFKNGDRVSGALSDATLDVTTASGVVKVNASDVARVAYAHARRKHDTVVLKNGDRVSGTIGPAALSVTTIAGETIRFDRSVLAGLESTH